MLRLSTEERRHIAEWLGLARSAFERSSAFRTTLYFPQVPEIRHMAQAEGVAPTVGFDTAIVTCYFIDLPGDWAQWVACDPSNDDEPLVFGEVYQSRRKRDEKQQELVRWLRNGAR